MPREGRTFNEGIQKRRQPPRKNLVVELLRKVKALNDKNHCLKRVYYNIKTENEELKEKLKKQVEEQEFKATQMTQLECQLKTVKEKNDKLTRNYLMVCQRHDQIQTRNVEIEGVHAEALLREKDLQRTLRVSQDKLKQTEVLVEVVEANKKLFQNQLHEVKEKVFTLEKDAEELQRKLVLWETFIDQQQKEIKLFEGKQKDLDECIYANYELNTEKTKLQEENDKLLQNERAWRDEKYNMVQTIKEKDHTLSYYAEEIEKIRQNCRLKMKPETSTIQLLSALNEYLEKHFIYARGFCKILNKSTTGSEYSDSSTQADLTSQGQCKVIKNELTGGLCDNDVSSSDLCLL